jgi:hypothetical protein
MVQKIILEYLQPGDLAVDAACGTGHDTAFLVGFTGGMMQDAGGSVIAFDIQEEAIRRTKEYLGEGGERNVTLVNDSFVHMDEYVEPGTAAVVMFNLGYLPGGNKTITTTAEETLVGLDKALEAIRIDGLVSVVMYSGHPEGAREKDAVMEWAAALDHRQYHVVYLGYPNQPGNPPEVLLITKKYGGNWYEEI